MQTDRTTSWVYFIETEDGRFVKIGQSRDVIRRFYELQTANPGLRLLGVLPETPDLSEYDVHQQFASDHHEGEWFHNSNRVGVFIKGLQQISLPARTVRGGVRARRRANRKQSMLPGFEHIPLTITISVDGKTVPLLDANTYGVREYLRVLMKGYRDRKSSDPKIKEVQALLAEMQRRSHDEKGITVREVILLDR